MNKKYLKFAIPIVLFILILLIGGFKGHVGIFGGCVKNEIVDGRNYCMGPAAVSFMGLTIQTGFIYSFFVSLIVALIIIVPKVAVLLINKKPVLLRRELPLFLWVFLVILLILTLCMVWMSRFIVY